MTGKAVTEMADREHVPMPGPTFPVSTGAVRHLASPLVTPHPAAPHLLLVVPGAAAIRTIAEIVALFDGTS